MRAGLFSTGLIALSALQLGAQQAPMEFEVAAIKQSSFQGRVGIRTEGGRFVAQHVSLADLVLYAYDLEGFQLSGGPAWVYSEDLYGTDRYEVLATSPGEAAPSLPQFRLMLQALLKDRFQVSAHRGSKDVPSYVLTQTEGGAKLKESILREGQSPSMWSSGRLESKYEASAVPIKSLLSVLRIAAGRPVEDRTGLAGTYAFTLQYANGDAPDPAVTAPSIFTALKEQLGLKLESVAVPFYVLILDKAERPSEN